MVVVVVMVAAMEDVIKASGVDGHAAPKPTGAGKRRLRGCQLGMETQPGKVVKSPSPRHANINASTSLPYPGAFIFTSATHPQSVS